MKNLKSLFGRKNTVNSFFILLLAAAFSFFFSNQGNCQNSATTALCPTPPMGWNSWNAFKKDINEKLFIESAEVLIKSGLADAGYVYVNIDVDGLRSTVH